MGKKKSMENVTIVINMVIEQMNGKRNQYLKADVTNERSIGANHKNAKPRY